MSNIPIPPYKPPKELQEILDQQAGQRKRTAKLPKRNWIYRNPRLFQSIFITSSLLLLFSKPLYDAFFSYPIPAIEGSIKLKKND